MMSLLQRPTLDHVVEWIDLDTICLLFGMVNLQTYIHVATLAGASLC